MKKNFERNGYKEIYLKKNKRKNYTLFVFMCVLMFLGIYSWIKDSILTSKESYTVFKEIDKKEDVQDTKEEYYYQDNNTNNQDARKILSNYKIISPVEGGEIIKQFSVSEPLYENTLDIYGTHNGIDIKKDLGDEVFCVCDGIVEKVYDDSYYGRTIVILHNNNFKSIYANLSSNTKVKKNEYVTVGKVIGYIGTTSIGELLDSNHLHFSILVGDEYIDPSLVIDF